MKRESDFGLGGLYVTGPSESRDAAQINQKRGFVKRIQVCLMAHVAKKELCEENAGSARGKEHREYSVLSTQLLEHSCIEQLSLSFVCREPHVLSNLDLPGETSSFCDGND